MTFTKAQLEEVADSFYDQANDLVWYPLVRAGVPKDQWPDTTRVAWQRLINIAEEADCQEQAMKEEA